MSDLLIWGISAGVCLSVSVVMFVLAIMRKNVKLALFSIIPFVLSGFIGAYAAWLAVTRTYDKVLSEMNPDQPEQVYEKVLGKADGCVDIKMVSTQIVPSMDPRTYIKSECCSYEVRRLIETNRYKVRNVVTSNFFLEKDPDSPVWFEPGRLGDTIILLESRNKEMHKFVFVKNDSTLMYTVEEPQVGPY